MVWKSREDKLPPPSFFALLTAHLQRTYPRARISRELMMELRPYFIEAWRNGKSAEATAQTTCSCNEHEIVPSPAIGIRIAKGSVRAPRGAQRGDVFGVEELREPAPVERLQKQLVRVSREQAKLQTVETKWEQRARTARKDATRTEAERKGAGVKSRNAELMAEAQRIEAEIRRVRTELSRPRQERAAELTAVAVPPRIQEPPPAPPRLPPTPPPSPPPAQTEAKAKKRKEPKASTPPSPPQSSESAALLSAIQGMLPNLASQLATQMTKDEGGAK